MEEEEKKSNVNDNSNRDKNNDKIKEEKKKLACMWHFNAYYSASLSQNNFSSIKKKSVAY